MILPVSLYLEYPPEGEISLKISSAFLYLVGNRNCKEMNFREKQENEKNKTKQKKKREKERKKKIKEEEGEVQTERP